MRAESIAAIKAAAQIQQKRLQFTIAISSILLLQGLHH